MKYPALLGPRNEQLLFVSMILFLLFCLVGGGASRADVASLLYVRPAAILCIAMFLIVPGRWEGRPLRIPFILLGGLALVMIVQLVPLPPGTWLSLPGHDRYREAAEAAAVAQPWRPLSLAPDLTLNSLLALLLPLAVLVAMAKLREDQRFGLLPLLIGAACFSAVLGIVQLTSARSSPVFLYEVTHLYSPVGFFSNRNHQAALLAMTFPMLRMWTLMPSEDLRYRRSRFWTAVAIGLFLIPMILVTGSRAGMGLAIIGLALAFLINPSFGDRRRSGAKRRRRWLAMQVLWLVPVLLVGAVLLLGRAMAVQRLLAAENLQLELRLQHAPLVWRMIWDFFPTGTGFGAFDPVFRGYEPDATLTPFYFNHAHNDLFELALTGGLPALLLLAIFLIWWGVKTAAAFRPLRAPSVATLFARLGASMILLLFLASLVDYPLRTPLMAAIFAVACGWLAQGQKSLKGRSDSG